MNYFIRENVIDEAGRKTATSKARGDADQLALRFGFTPLDVYEDELKRAAENPAQKVLTHLRYYAEWSRLCRPMTCGDVLFVQFPARSHSVLLPRLFQRLNGRGVRIVMLLHDLEILRSGRRAGAPSAEQTRLLREEVGSLKECASVIAHNEEMARALVEMGVDKDKIVNLQIFDYLLPELDQDRLASREIAHDAPIVVAGNLSRKKAEYLYRLPEGLPVNLFGPFLEGMEEPGDFAPDVRYFGSFDPDDLPYALAGSFGLIWDGPTPETCEGPYGEYLRINDPHKASLYLASGLPLVMWSQAALASFVTEHTCGILVDSLAEIPAKIAALSPRDYEQMRTNAEDVGGRLREGYYLRRAMLNSLKMG